jgi:flagellar basal-body rod protein FlgB
MNATNDLAMTLLSKGMDAMSSRQTAISNNLANIETPNYKAVGVAFEEQLRFALNQSRGETISLARTDGNHLNAQGNPHQRIEETNHQMIRLNQTAMRKDGNNVDVETEMMQMAETGLRYQAMSTLATRKLAILRMIAQTVR